jgi:hypothetical protein
LNRRRFLSDAAQIGAGITLGKPILHQQVSATWAENSAPAEAVPNLTDHSPSPSPELAAARKCFSGNLFNLAIDYWGTDWVDSVPYGSGYTRESYLHVLKELNPGFIQIYAKGESGRTSFRSATHSEHPKLAKNDVLPFFRELTREAGVKLFLYWSGLEDAVAGGHNPDWCCVDPQQKPIRTGTFLPGAGPISICPQSAFLDEWVSVQLREAIALSDASGMWVDGTWIGPCFCHRCVGRFRQETGFKGAIPEGDEWEHYWAKVQYEFRVRWLKVVRAIKPDILTSFGNISVRQEFLDDRDWFSGDRYSPNHHRYEQSLAMRRYSTVGIPYEAWICDTQMLHYLADVRPRTKSLDRMLQEGATILANGGQWTYWTFSMPNGALVPSRMRQAAKALEFARERREQCMGTQSIRWTALLELSQKNRWFDDYLWGAGKALINLHRSPDLIDEGGLSDDAPYDLVVVGEQPAITPEAVDKLEAFVRRGGKLISTGASGHSPEMAKLLGIKVVQPGAVDEAHAILKGGGPVGVYAPWDKLELVEAEEFYPAYLSNMHQELKPQPVNWCMAGLLDEVNPERAGFPAATVRRLGKGAAVHIPTDLFAVYWKYGYLDILAWLQEITKNLQPSPLFRTDAYTYVEVVLRQKAGALLVHFINGNPGHDMSYVKTEDLFVDEIPPLGPITSWVRCAQRPHEVTWEPGGIAAETSWEDGVLKVVLPRLEIHACLKVQGWSQAT